MSVLRCLLCLLVLLVACSRGLAVINPFEQPVQQVEKYRGVLVLRVTAVDTKARSITASVKRVVKGAFTPTEVCIRTGSDVEEALFGIGSGRLVVAFVGKTIRRHEDELLCYAGGGAWYFGKMTDPSKPAEWEWTSLGPANSFYGIFNGSAERFAEMMEDIADNRDYFPAQPYCRFHSPRELGKLDQPVRGVALADLDGEGRLDAIATSAAGVRIWLQRDGLRFEDATAVLGLAGVKASSVAVAKVDVAADGPPDLLLDGVLWLRSGTGFVRTDRVPAISGLISASFAEMDGDGWPDVLAATTSGVRIFLNPGKPGAPFIDATGRLGLDRPECGAGALAAAMSDWDGQGGTALFLGTPQGMLLSRGKDGVFHPLKTPALDLKTTTPGQRTGGAVFGALWQRGAASVLVPRESGFALLVSNQDRILDVISSCNETSEPAARQLWTLAEDLNADGEVDIYTASGVPDVADVCHLNRGYGSYMRPMKYDAKVFPEPGYATGSWGVAAGDVDGDGTADLLLGGCDGTVRLLLNDSLALRRDINQGSGIYLRRLAAARVVAVELAGPRGRVGATLTLQDAKSRVIAKRYLNGNGVAGSWSGGTTAIAVREAGAYTLQVRRSDGSTSTVPLIVESTQPQVKRIVVKQMP